MDNPFVLQKSEYKRDLDLLKGFFSQNTLFLHKMTGQPKDKCLKFVRKQVSRNGSFPIKDPNMLVLRQESPGNRVRAEVTLLQYVKEVTETKRILSPSMVCYERPDVLKSPTAKFVEAGIAGRKKAKNEMFRARTNNDKVLEKIKNSEQNAKKIAINSLSGMHGFAGNILYVKSGHSSLTSMCRTATGYGNANNERLLAGSRHYWSVDIALSNMLSLIDSQPHDEFDNALKECGLVYPSVQDTVECIKRSTDLYWRNATQFQKLVDFIVRLEPVERAIVVYTGDLHHITKLNEQFVRGWMDKMIKFDPYADTEVFDDPGKYLNKSVDGDTAVLAVYLNADMMKGTNIEKLVDAEQTPEIVHKLTILARTAKNIVTVLQEYFTFIRVFLTPKQLPPSVANIKGILRRVVLASDTDSTIFTTQDWVTWYTGSDARTKEGDGIWYTTTYIACQCIVHVLAMFSANMGVIAEDLHRLSMKNEFAFPVFVLTSRAKHYYASRSAQEGNVKLVNDMEIKGVALRSSAVPVAVIQRATDLMKEVLETAEEGRQFSLDYLYHCVWEWEQDIYTSIKKGEHKYLKSGQIQESYANMETSNYRHFLMWNEVFGPKYGMVDKPPYSIIKVPLRIKNKTDMKDWLAHMTKVDADFGKRMTTYALEKNRDTIATLLLPHQILSGTGMPDEVMEFIDIRRLTYEILESFYMILETVGIFQVDSKYVRLISDIYSPEGEVNQIPAPTDQNSIIHEGEEAWT
jgi:hypothetical protein